MKPSIKVAVVIVNWNSGAYLVECLLSLKGQTLLPDRVLIVDNASTDGSMEGLEQRFPDFEFIHLKKILVLPPQITWRSIKPLIAIGLHF
jgi:GT2 family glycosyltransferase